MISFLLCTKQFRKFQVLENVPAGSYITTVRATDKDSGANGEITYSFGSGDTDGFQIDPVLGQGKDELLLSIFRMKVVLFFCSPGFEELFLGDCGEVKEIKYLRTDHS